MTAPTIALRTKGASVSLSAMRASLICRARLPTSRFTPASNAARNCLDCRGKSEFSATIGHPVDGLSRCADETLVSTNLQAQDAAANPQPVLKLVVEFLKNTLQGLSRECGFRLEMRIETAMRQSAEPMRSATERPSGPFSRKARPASFTSFACVLPCVCRCSASRPTLVSGQKRSTQGRSSTSSDQALRSCLKTST